MTFHVDIAPSDIERAGNVIRLGCWGGGLGVSRASESSSQERPGSEPGAPSGERLPAG